LIPALIRPWIAQCKQKHNLRLEALGAAYLRWVSRVSIRTFTNTGAMLTKAACDPETLERRDIAKYSCTQNQQCPSTSYLMRKVGLVEGDDDNDVRWNKIKEGSLRDNENFTLAASIGDMFDI
jgi:hypothetical protein